MAAACFGRASLRLVAGASLGAVLMARIVRDADVALQHLILSPNDFDVRGRLMLGFDPGTPVV